MRSFQQVVVLLFALLFAFAIAQDPEPSYDATVYITSTITRVNTITLSGSHTASLANSTSTIPASHITGAPNSTVAAPTSTAPTTTAQFTGAASHLTANAILAAVAAGVGYLAL